jgi:hypothetical protein
VVYFCFDCNELTVLDTNDDCSKCSSSRVAPKEELYWCEECETFTVCDEENKCLGCCSQRVTSAETRRDNFNLERIPKEQTP